LLRKAHGEFDCARRLLKSAPSTYFNPEEAFGGQPGQDFNPKVAMPYHEAREKRGDTKYLASVNPLSFTKGANLQKDAEERYCIPGSIQPAMRNKPWLT
jgi:hypothetical protein